MARKFRICLPYFMIFFCSFVIAATMYTRQYFLVAANLILALYWLRQFITTVRHFRLRDEFDSIIAEAKKRIESGAPAGELIEMAQDRLDKMC